MKRLPIMGLLFIAALALAYGIEPTTAGVIGGGFGLWLLPFLIVLFAREPVSRTRIAVATCAMLTFAGLAWLGGHPLSA